MRYPLLNYLRGVAAVWVFAHHLAWSRADVTAPGVILRGYFGVPMFFVISGFCLAAAARQARDRGDSMGTFLTRRLLRVYPPLWAALGVAVVVYAFGPAFGWPAGPFGAEYAPPSWAERPAGDWLGTMTLTQAFTGVGEYPWRKFLFVNIVLWTLAIEVQFYLVVALALLAGRWSRLVIGVVTAAAIPVGFLPGAFQSGLFLPHWPMFALGLALYAGIERWPLSRPRTLRIAGLVAAAVFLAIGLVIAPADPDIGPGMVAGELIFATGLAAGLWLLWDVGPPRILTGWFVGPLVAAVSYAGTVSYSLYLLHVPLLQPARSVVSATGFGDWLVDGLVVVVVLAVCYPFHRWFERPWTSSARRGSAGPGGATLLPSELGPTDPASRCLNNAA
ncbi:MAG TPA: acyltransferase [Gemmataceae bacterium]|nr:acyltransferase [Gemmataceae bacterium]